MTEKRHSVTRREMIKAGAGGALGLYGAGILAGCGSGSGSTTSSAGGSSPSAESSGPPQGGTPKRGGALRVGVVTGGSSETVSPLAAIVPPDLIRVQAIFDPLFIAGNFGAVKPGLVTEAHPNRDASVWTFHLRREVTWHDGKPFTADDVVYTIQHSWGSSKNTFNPVMSALVDFKNVRKVDDFTVQVPLVIPIAEFPSVTCLQNLYVVQNGATNFTEPVGTGPFVYKSFTPGNRSVFTANPNYWEHGKPYVDELIIDSSFAEPNPIANSLLSGQIDVMPAISPALAKANAESGRIYLGNVRGPGWCAPMARVDIPPFNDPRVIQAFKLFPDRDLIVDAVFDGYATPGNDAPGSTLKNWVSDIKAEHDPEKAKALLKEAGQENLAITLATSPIAPGMVEMATVYAQQAKSAGVNMSVKQYDPAAYYAPSEYLKRDLGMEIWTVGINSLPIFYMQMLYPGAPYDETHWVESHPQDTKILKEALGEVDEAKAEEKWRAVQELQIKEGGQILLANYNWLDGYGLNVRGVKTTNAGPCDYWQFQGAWLEA